MNNLPYCEKELANVNRNRKGVHVFLHWYRLEFNNLPTVQKRRIIGDNYMHRNNHNHNHNHNNNDDDDDEDGDVIFDTLLSHKLVSCFGNCLVNV